MPRGPARRTQTGEKAQTVRSVPGQRYGEGQDSAAIQQAMPAPDRSGAPSASAPAPQQPVIPSVGRPDPTQVASYLNQHKPSLLSATQMPEIPVTDGLSTGPGRGISAARPSASPLRRFMENLSADTGDPRWARIMERAGL